MKTLAQAIVFGLVVYALFLASVGDLGFVGPDEPRYADVAREMVITGDYVTPRLFGQPWFEKPPLYYWLAAAMFHIRVDEAAARFPSAGAAALFVGLWFWFAERFYGLRAAQLSCLMLASSAGWVGFSRAASTDMLFATTLGTSLMLLAFWLWKGKAAALYGFYALLGFATLAKGPLAIGLVGMIVLAYVIHRRRWRELRQILLTPAIAAFFVVSLPWYVLCYRRNGFPFIQEFFIRQNWQRLVSSEAIGHGQPFWFYAAVLLGAIFPWTPLLGLPIWEAITRGWRATMDNSRMTFLFYWTVLPFVFFSLAQNKLPGYLLPILPPATLWIAASVARRTEPAKSADSAEAVFSGRSVQYWMTACIVILGALPWISVLLPEALAAGITQALATLRAGSAARPLLHGVVPFTAWLTVGGLLVAALVLLWRGKILDSAAMILVAVAGSVLAICYYVSPAINRVASVRNVAKQVDDFGLAPGELAVYHLDRSQVYGLGFYLGYLPPEWQPDAGSQGSSLVAARDDVRIEQLKPGAQSLALFPGLHLRLWGMYGWP